MVAIDRENDLAIIKIPIPTTPLYLKTGGDVELGEPVSVVGYPNIFQQGISAKWTSGSLSSLNGLRDDPRHYQIDAAIQPGNSGGPLLNNDRHVIGIVVSTLVGFESADSGIPQNVNYAIKVDGLQPLIRSDKSIEDAVRKVRPPAVKPNGNQVAASTYLIGVKAYPTAAPVQDLRGRVFSPFARDKVIDVRDFESGEIVKCPYTGKFFMVP